MQLEALFHDAAETYVGDWIRPLSRMLGAELKTLRDQIQTTCFTAAGVTRPSEGKSPAVHEADELMQRYELQSTWGFDRPVAWQRPMTAAETARVERTMIEVEKPPEYRYQKRLLANAFLKTARTLLPPSAPMRRTI